MNGIPVSPGQKTENAPTWRSPSPLFGGLFLAYFGPFSPLSDPVLPIPTQPISSQPNTQHLFFIMHHTNILYPTPVQQYNNGRGILITHSLSNPIYNTTEKNADI